MDYNSLIIKESKSTRVRENFNLIKKLKYVRVNTLNIFPLMLFAFSPFLSITLFVLILVCQKSPKSSSYYLLISFISIYLGLINLTKTPESDLATHIDFYLLANDLSLAKYVILFGKEPLYFLFSYITYYITAGSVKLFIIAFTFISYFFFLKAIYLFFKKMEVNNTTIIFSIIIGSFFPQLFLISAHLIRQFMAASFLMYALVLFFFYDKKKTAWIFLVFSILTHTTTLLFVPFFFINKFKEKINYKHVLYLFFPIIIIGSILPYISTVIVNTLGNNIFTYVFFRLGLKDPYQYEPISFLQYFTLALVAILALWLHFNQKAFKKVNIQAGINQFTYTVIFLTVFIVSNLSNSELSVRYFFFIYFFLPFIISLILMSNRIEYILLRFLLSFSLITFFFYKIENGIWEYESLLTLIFSNIFKLSS